MRVLLSFANVPMSQQLCNHPLAQSHLVITWENLGQSNLDVHIAQFNNGKSTRR